jgi:glycosyltransferase involved in cell wall biosynthesis
MVAPHRIIVESFTAQDLARERGISTYLGELLGRVATRSEVSVSVRTNESLPPIGIESPLHDLVRTDRHLAEAMRGASSPWVHVTGGPFPPVPGGSRILPRWIREARPGLIAIVYDIIPWLFRGEYLPSAHAQSAYLAHVKLIKTLDHVMTISDSARNDLVEHFGFDPDRVTTIGTGVDRTVFSPGTVNRTDALVSGDRGIVLVVGGSDRRKNITRMLTAWSGIGSRLRAEHRLVVVCRLDPDMHRGWLRHAVETGLEPDEVVFTDTIAQERVVNLYRAARLVVFPSLYEGYGLPVAEAASVGAPVICSDTSAMPGIVGDPAGTFDPHSAPSITNKLVECLSDDTVLAGLVRSSRAAAGRLGWDPVVERFLACTERHARKPRSRSTAPRISLISPESTALSGVAVHTGLIAEHLARMERVELLRDGRPAAPSTSADEPGCIPASALQRWDDPHPLSHVVAVIGNSPFHVHAYRHAVRRPCHVWIHDLTLEGVAYHAADSLPSAEERAQFLNSLLDPLQVLPHRFRAHARHHDPGRLRALGHRFIEPLLRGSRSVIVSSQSARAIVAGTGMIDDDRVTVIPLGFRLPTVRAERSERPTVVAMGMVGFRKDAETAIRAMAHLDPEVRLVFAGAAHDTVYRAELEGLAARMGVSERVEFTGALDDDEYWRWCMRGWVGLQLRKANHGEGSGAVTDLMAAGTPVVSGLPSSRELPAGTVSLLPHRYDDESVVTAVGALLDDDSARNTLGSAGLAHARSWTHRHVAEALRDWLLAVDGGDPAIPGGRAATGF